ncbi:MAG TPA: hypothetical protein VGK33_23365, partial [Chloroflexota bacterium]
MSASPPTAVSGLGVASWRAWLSGGRLLIVLAAASLLVALISLRIPSTPSYDPWSWLLWGREILDHRTLHTQGGPSWKALPIVFTVPFALFGHLQPNLWLLVARAGAAMAIVMSGRIAWRVIRETGESAESSGAIWWVAPLIAGLIAAASLFNAPGFLSNSSLGYSEGLAIAFMLCAVDRFMDGRRDQAFILGLGLALDRPESWLLWIPFGLWLAWTDPKTRWLVGALIVLNFLLWFGPAGVSGVTRAQHPRKNSAAFTSCPLCTVFRHQAWPMVLNRIKVPAIIGMLVAAALLARSRADWWRKTIDRASARRIWLIVIGVFGFGWWLGVALETQAGGFSGNSRYLAFGTAAVGIAGAIAWGGLIQWLATQLSRLGEARATLARFARRSVALPTGAVAAVALFFVVPPWVGRNLISLPKTHHALVDQALLRENLNQIIRNYGGPNKLLACGTVMTEGFQVPMVSWALDVRMLRVEAEPSIPSPPYTGLSATQKYAAEHDWAPLPAPNVILQARSQPGAALLPLPDTILHWEA